MNDTIPSRVIDFFLTRLDSSDGTAVWLSSASRISVQIGSRSQFEGGTGGMVAVADLPRRVLRSVLDVGIEQMGQVLVANRVGRAVG